MEQYIILFYRKKKDSISCAKYYREFENWEQIIEWAKSVKQESNYASFKTRKISATEFLKNV